MSRTVGIEPRYLEKLSERQKKFILTAVGRKFFQEYICRKGNHTYNISNTGGGKTQRNYWLVDWLRHTENIIWLSTGKTDEILPLLFMGCKVRIVIPKGAEFKIIGTECLDRQPEIIEVSTPGEAWWNVWGPGWDHNRNKTFNKITIFEFRNTISPDIRSDWMADLFTELAEWSREGTMPKIFPCAIFIDESQWVLAGTRITTDQKRNKTSEIITENALEIRSVGGRLVFSAQDFKNVTPASRENMLNGILGRGATVSAEENKSWSTACGDYRQCIRNTSTFQREYARFVFDDGRFYPNDPWKFPLFPEKEEDREKLYGMTVKYGQKFCGRKEEEKEKEELCPELGRFSHLAIPPEKAEAPTISRFGQVIDDD
jgi:hypothetical protein